MCVCVWGGGLLTKILKVIIIKETGKTDRQIEGLNEDRQKKRQREGGTKPGKWVGWRGQI